MGETPAKLFWFSQDLKLPEWLKKGLAKEKIRPQMVAWSFYSGDQNTPLDYKQAYLWFCRALKEGCSDAAYFIGEMYYFGFYVKDSTPEAVKWLEVAAAQNKPAALEFLFDIYLNGEHDFKKDLSGAKKIALKEKKLGLSIYALHLGDILYQEGDLAGARKYYQKAHKAGFPAGAFKIYLMDKERNPARVVKGHGLEWLKKAARGGSIEARTVLRSHLKVV